MELLSTAFYAKLIIFGHTRLNTVKAYCFMKTVCQRERNFKESVKLCHESEAFESKIYDLLFGNYAIYRTLAFRTAEFII